MKFVKPVFGLMVIVSLGMIALQPALAQNNQPPQVSTGVLAFSACSEVDYRDVAAKALGMTVADLRKALTSGKSLQDIATGKNISIDTVTAALEAARKAAVDQAIKDGILTQQEADQMAKGPQDGAMPGGNPPAQGQPNGNPPDQGQNGQNGGQPGNPPAQDQNGGQPGNPPAQGQDGGQAMPTMDRIAMQYGISALNTPRLYVVTASTLNMKCVDLVKSLSANQGQTIAGIAKVQNVDVNQLIATLVKANQTALADDVQNGIITQAQSDAQNANLTTRMTDFVNNANGLSRMGMGGGPGGMQDGQPGGQPPAAPNK